jgi:hypothetical protein
MQSKIVALLAEKGSREATLLVRRGNGQFALSRIDARVAAAARLADLLDASTPTQYSSLEGYSPKR